MNSRHRRGAPFHVLAWAAAMLLVAAAPSRAQTAGDTAAAVDVALRLEIVAAKAMATHDSVAPLVELRGVVTTVPERVTADGYTFYMQDGTAGVRAYAEGALVRILGPGDSIRVLGRIGVWGGTERLQATELEVVARGISPAPVPVTIGEVLAGRSEGLLVEIDGTSAYRENPEEDDDIIVYIRNSGDQLRVDIPDEFYQQPLLADRIRDRRRVRIIGVVQAPLGDDPVRIVPRAPSDMQFAPKPSPATLLAILAIGLLAGLALYLGLRRRAAERYLIELYRTTRELERSERALSESEKRFRALVEHSFGMVLIVDRNCTVQYISEAARAFGFENRIAADSLRFLFRHIHPDDRRSVAAELRRMQADARGHLELRIGSDVDGYRHISAQLSDHLDDPTIGGVVVHARDITAHRSAEQALAEMKERLDQAQRLDAIGRLAGGVAHDFNNLLTVIRGNATLLSETATAGAEELRQIELAADRAAEMTRKLLAFGRRNVERGECVDVGATVREIEAVIRRLIPVHIGLTFDLPEPELLINADTANLEQVLLNLLLNARDAIGARGTIRVAVRSVEVREPLHCRTGLLVPGSYVRIAVEDDGAGMDDVTLRRLFEPYFTTKKVGHGTGLGLPTVYGIVSECGGQVQVSSRTGAGTTMQAYFPRVVEAPAPSKPARTGTDPVGSGTVLVVEDEDQVRSYVCRVLIRGGYDVLDAPSGEAALQLLDRVERAPDALITDVIMPGMPGPQLAAEVRARHPDTRIMFISGYAADALPGDPQWDDVAIFREKPFSPAELLQALEDLMASGEPVR